MASALAARSAGHVRPVRARTISLVWGRLAAAAAVVVTVGVGIGVGLNLKYWTGPQTPNAQVAVNQKEADDATKVAKFVEKPAPAPKGDKEDGKAERREDKPEEPAKKQTGPSDLHEGFAIDKPEKGGGHGQPEGQKAAPANNAAVSPGPHAQADQNLAKVAAGQRSESVEMDKDQAKDGKEQQTVKLACDSISDVRKNVKKLLAENGVNAEAEEIQKAQESPNNGDYRGGVAAVNRPDTIMIQVSVNQDQYYNIRKGLDKINSEQLALRNRNGSNDLIASAKNAKAGSLGWNSILEETLKKLYQTDRPGGDSSDPSARKIVDDNAGADMNKQNSSAPTAGKIGRQEEKLEIAAADESRRKLEKEKAFGSGGKQQVESGGIGGGGANTAAGVNPPAGPLSKAPPTPAAMAPVYSGRAVSRPAETRTTAASQHVAPQIERQAGLQEQQQKLITLTIVLNAYTDRPGNAAQPPPANLAGEPATQPAQGK
ncbi:MAG: hypothetical protein HZA50_05050, partial [Planctomycetes bacterium]|nr:hypothetical protein [Planctomycetota bacterium]